MQQHLFNVKALKKATNLTINSDLLAKSRALKINLSATLEEALTEKLAKYAAEQWSRENRLAIDAYNEIVESQGCFADEYRSF